MKELPVRMCAVVPTEDGRHQAFCIACGWLAKPQATKAAAERVAKRHSCRKRGG